MLIRSVNWQKLRNISQVVLLTDRASFFSSVPSKWQHSSLTTSQCRWNPSSNRSCTSLVLSRSLPFFILSCSSLTLSVTSLIITSNLQAPFTSTLFLVSVTVRQSIEVLRSLMLNIVDFTSKVYMTSVRVNTLEPRSSSSMDRLGVSSSIFSATSSALTVFSSWKHRFPMSRY